jgi:hypothetical protein
METMGCTLLCGGGSGGFKLWGNAGVGAEALGLHITGSAIWSRPTGSTVGCCFSLKLSKVFADSVKRVLGAALVATPRSNVVPVSDTGQDVLEINAPELAFAG